MNNNKLLRWGMIGCGNVTELKSAPAYKLVDGFELTAVMGRNFDHVSNYAQRHKIKKYYTNADELISDKDIDAIYIATPPDSHFYYALKVAESGKICCIEKPLAPSYEECLSISNIFKNKKIPLFVAYYRRSLPRFEQVKTWLDKKEIGEPVHVNWLFTRPPKEIDMSGKYNWRTDPKIAPGAYFDDLACHGLDLFAFLLGDYSQVFGKHKNQQGYYKASDSFTACWEHEDGTLGSGIWNFACDSYEDRVEIFGSKGKIEFAVFKEAPLILTKQNEVKSLFIDNPKNIQFYHVKNMARQLSNKSYVHPSNGLTATHTAWVMDSILGKKNE